MNTARRPEARAPTDNELFARMAEGDLGALGELFDRYHVSVKSFLARILPRSGSGLADVDDVVQDTFLTASRAAASFEPSESARPFLLGVAAQLARRRRRSFARLRAMLDRFAFVPSLPPPSPEDTLSESERVELVEAALARLSHDHREVILLVDLGELSGVEAAKALGIPPGTVWRRLHEARGELRDRVSRRGR